MGAWGAGILQDDSARDIIYEYKTLLGYKVPNDEAYQLIKDYFYRDFKGSDDEDIFWFALAIYQVRNGILVKEVKEQALQFLENPLSLEVWKESGENIYKNRLRVLEKLKHEILQPSITKPKNISKPPSYYRDKTFLKEGDIVAAKMIENDWLIKRVPSEYIGKYFLFSVICVNKNPISRLKPELDYSATPFMALYKWIGNNISDIESISHLPLVKMKDYKNFINIIVYTDFKESSQHIKIIGNNKDYIAKQNCQHNNGIYCGFNSMMFTAYQTIEYYRNIGEKFEALGD